MEERPYYILIWKITDRSPASIPGTWVIPICKHDNHDLLRSPETKYASKHIYRIQLNIKYLKCLAEPITLFIIFIFHVNQLSWRPCDLSFWNRWISNTEKKERNPTLWKKICYKGLSGMMQHKNKPTSRTSIFALFEKLFMCSTELTSRECIGLTVLDFNWSFTTPVILFL